MPQPSLRNPIGVPFIELQSVDSTNNYARSLIHEGLAQHGTAIFAHDQLTGKGQRSKTWFSEKGLNLLLSVLVQPGKAVLSQQFWLSMAVSNAACTFFSRYAGDDVSIKWPNDIYWQDRKAGGILIESMIRAGDLPEWEWAIAGTGLNINQGQFPASLPNPVSILQITGKKYDPVDLAEEYCKELEKHISPLLNDVRDGIHEQYLDSLYKKNEKVHFRQDSRVFEATVKSVTQDGKLVLEHAIEEEFGFGQISWIL